jgi:peptidoglycan hydrolase-like protein with peptidoglycan-binding domain
VHGDAGDAVVRVQQALVAAGIGLPGGADGTFGQATANAISTFQRQKGLDMSGVVDQATAIALGIRGAPASGPPTTTAAAPAPDSATAGPLRPSASELLPTGGGDRTRNLPWVALVAVNAVLALYVRRRIRAARRQRSLSEARSNEASVGERTGRGERRTAFFDWSLEPSTD